MLLKTVPVMFAITDMKTIAKRDSFRVFLKSSRLKFLGVIKSTKARYTRTMAATAYCPKKVEMNIKLTIKT